jgi:Domain of unknown function (DUF4352)
MSQATSVQPHQQPQAPTPQKKGKTKWILLLVVAVVVIVSVTQAGGGESPSGSAPASGDSSSSDTAQAVGLNQPVRDGKFEFTVTNMDCSQNTLGTAPVSTQANGVFCLVSVAVANIGDEAQTLDAMSQVAYDAQNREYSTDIEAAFYLENGGDALFNQLNPGSSVNGVLVFDVPAGTQLTTLELHDSALSGGVTVKLG